MSRGLARALGVAAAVVLLALVTSLAMVGGPRDDLPRSVHGLGDEGWRAAYLLLAELGLHPSAWEQPPGLLPRGHHLLWMPGVPVDPREGALGAPGTDRDQALEALRMARDASPRSPRHYRGFLEQGGRLVVPLSKEMLAFLVDDLGLRALQGSEVEPIVPAPEKVTMGDEELALDLPRAERLVGLDPALPRETLARTPDGDSLALEIPVGRGGLVLLGNDDFLDNARLRDADHALFLTRLVEALAPDGEVAFDENALGRWSEEGVLSLAFGADTRLASVHLLLLALLAIWMLAWPREFPRDPEPVEPTAPIERARAEVALALRAGRPGVLARFLVDGTLRRVAARLRVPLEAGRTPREELERLAAAAGLPAREERVARWCAEVLDSPRSRREDLARLDAALRALEHELGGRAPSVPPRRAPARSETPEATA